MTLKILKMSIPENMSHAFVNDINNGHLHQSSVDEEGYSSAEQISSEIVEVIENENESYVSEGCAEVNSVPNVNVHLDMVKKCCRICRISIDMTDDNAESDTTTPIELGCMCKNDLATTHKHCAEHWFRIKGNKICEVCGSIARNVASAFEIELLNETRNDIFVVPPPLRPTLPVDETLNFWQDYLIINIIVVCLVCSFVVTWLFGYICPHETKMTAYTELEVLVQDHWGQEWTGFWC